MDQRLDPDRPFAHARFDGQFAVITGGTQGLGLATARLMKARGAAGLVIVGRDPEKGEAARAGLDGDGCRAVFVSADLATDEGIERLVTAADREFGAVHSFVNCAAATWRGTVWNTTAQMWDDMLAMNVKMPGLLVSALARIMKREGIAGSMVMSAWSRATNSPGRWSRTVTTSISLWSCLVICSMVSSSPWVVRVMWDTDSSSVGATFRLSML